MNKRMGWWVIIVAVLFASAAGCSKKPPAGEMVPPPDRSTRDQVAPSQERTSSEASDTSRDVRMTIEDVYFEYDKHTLTPAGRDVLAKNADYLMKNPDVKILIEGHCDERGTREYNLALGDRRASAARDFLVSYGVHPSRVETISYGKERPFDGGHDEAAWAKNRRAHFKNQ